MSLRPLRPLSISLRFLFYSFNLHVLTQLILLGPLHLPVKVLTNPLSPLRNIGPLQQGRAPFLLLTGSLAVLVLHIQDGILLILRKNISKVSPSFPLPVPRTHYPHCLPQTYVHPFLLGLKLPYSTSTHRTPEQLVVPYLLTRP